MYQNCCKKCGSISLHTEIKGNNTGLYCNDCGSYIKWLSKDELRAFEHSQKEENKDVIECEIPLGEKQKYFRVEILDCSGNRAYTRMYCKD